jgi:hypothetical protein
VETSTFSAEFIAPEGMFRSYRTHAFQAAMFWRTNATGEPTHVFCDNESVVKNTTNVESTLNKKHSSVAVPSLSMVSSGRCDHSCPCQYSGQYCRLFH